MTFYVIACRMFQHEVEAVLPEIPHRLRFSWLEMGEHARPDVLRGKLQHLIDTAGDCDAVLLLYGLCGRATAGLTAGSVPLVIPRNHDCGGILLGSRRRFEELFRDMPSTPFSSVGIVENGNYFFDEGVLTVGDDYEKLVEQYGEDNARYIRDAMNPRLDGELQPVWFISTPEVSAGEARETCRRRAHEDGREFRELAGDLRLIRMLLNGDHPDDEFLTVPPGAGIRQVYDWDRIVAAASVARR